MIKMLLGKLCFLFLPFFVSGLHLERRGYRDLVVKVVYMMEIMKAIMIIIRHEDAISDDHDKASCVYNNDFSKGEQGCSRTQVPTFGRKHSGKIT